MRIDVKGRNVPVGDDLSRQVKRHRDKRRRRRETAKAAEARPATSP